MKLFFFVTPHTQKEFQFGQLITLEVATAEEREVVTAEDFKAKRSTREYRHSKTE